MDGHTETSPGPLWLDQSDAESRIEAMAPRIGQPYATGLRDLARIGFTTFPGAMDPVLCDQVNADYQAYLSRNHDYASGWVDGLGRHNRLVNFHMTSPAALKLGASPFLMGFLDLVFGRKAGIYTSLTFEFGTEQPIHRDSPFFHTFPVNYFVGAWVALEDIVPEAGPLMYVPGGHRFTIDQHAFYREARARRPDAPKDEVVLEALEHYNGAIIDRSADIAPIQRTALKKGDLAIWHATLPHGGSPASDKSRTRRSIVFHCAPEALQVYQHDVFFSHEGPTAPPPRYGFRAYGERTYAVAGETAFM
ncbi:MAG TPA: phytanoyl-CoA dioxygenase family protein [Caulobacteraceae bacterium]